MFLEVTARYWRQFDSSRTELFIAERDAAFLVVLVMRVPFPGTWHCVVLPSERRQLGDVDAQQA
jgi:uncharacterized membrane protein